MAQKKPLLGPKTGAGAIPTMKVVSSASKPLMFSSGSKGGAGLFKKPGFAGGKKKF